METVDLRELKRIQAKAAGKPVPEFPGPYLFWYTVFTFIQDKQFTTLSEDQAKEKLLRYPKTEIFLLKFPKSTTPIPEIIKNRRGLQTIPCTSHEMASEIIYSKTNVKISEMDLMTKKVYAKNERPLINQIRDLNKKSNKDRIVALYDCIAIKDAKKRAQCYINKKCKS
jgi:hypothetical protein